MLLEEPATRTVVWVTNNAAPYRKPVWQALGRHTRLEVRILESDAQLRRRRRRGADWAVAATSALDTYSIRALRTWALGRGERIFFFLLGRLQLPRGRVDAILLGGWESPAYWQAFVVARLRGARAVAFYESTLASQRHSGGVIGKVRSSYFRAVDAVVVPGVAAREALRIMGVEDSKIYLGFNAVNVTAFRRHSTQASPPHEGHRYVYVGQLIPRKNVEGLILAFGAASEHGDSLTIVGSGDQELALRALAATTTAPGSVIFRGSVANEDLPEVLWEQNTLVLPSTEEVWGLVINEALAAGLHAIVSEECGVAASVDGMQGAFVTSSSVEALASALVRSREAWRGPIQDPEILAHTPEALAATFESALLARAATRT